MTLATSDDGVHADDTLTVSGGTLAVTGAYEGLEATTIVVSGGDTSLTTSDDGVNAGGGVDGSGAAGPGGTMDGGMGGGMGGRGRPGADASAGTASDTAVTGGTVSADDAVVVQTVTPEATDTATDTATSTATPSVTISGGTLVVDAEGDGLDSNGTLAVTGGVVVVHGPTAPGNGALDSDAALEISGGVLVAADDGGMAQAPGTASTQASVGFSLGGTLPAGSVVHVVASDGTVVASVELAKDASTLVVSTPDLLAGDAYTVYEGGTVTETVGGYGTGGDLTGATQLGTTTASGA
ncbi:carbohydrate-binding domain-containing protein [Cellulomonas sp. ATA003]|nr:carbohydrate-binding domain-containing protein [Cellulomonas sp. ATA003]WNB87622.1 carbohydrate-binding domain-containing protein [Cellulomonas sp. ATA003]